MIRRRIPPGTGVVLRTLIDDGLRAQLAIPSLVTGQATVSLDLFPGSPAELHNGYPGRVEIPTVPSTLQEVQATLEQIYDKLSKLPLDELVEDTRTLIKAPTGWSTTRRSHRRSSTPARPWLISSK